MKKLLLASAAVAALVAGSAAAENDFTGFNFGLQGGFAQHKHELKTNDGKGNLSKAGATVGLFAGYGYQFDNAMYLGAELEANINTGTASKKGTDTDGDVFKLSAKSKNSIGANLRAGYVFNDNILAYALAGLVRPTNELKTTVNGIQDKKGANHKLAYKVGAGAEMKFADNYFARVQYDYTIGKKDSYKDEEGDKFSYKVNQHNARVGLGMII